MVVLTYCYHYLYPYSSYHYYHYWFYYFITIISKFYCYYSHHYYYSQYYQCYLYHFISFYFLLFILPWLLSVCCVWRVCVLSYIFFPFLVNDLHFIIALLIHVKNHFLVLSFISSLSSSQSFYFFQCYQSLGENSAN